MKKIAGNTWVKLLIGLLTMVLTAICAGAIFLAVMASVYGAYSGGNPEEAVDRYLKSMMFSDLDDVYNGYFQTTQAAEENTDPSQTEYYERELENYKNIYDPEQTNFRFTIKDQNGNVVLTNIPEGEEPDYWAWISHSQTAFDGTYGDTNWGGVTPVPEVTPTPSPNTHAELEAETTPEEDSGTSVYTLYGYVMSGLPVSDKYLHQMLVVQNLVYGENYYIPVAVISGVAALALAVYLMYAAGRRTDTEEIHLRAIDRMPWDLYLCLGTGVVAAVIAGAVAYIELYRFDYLYYNFSAYNTLTSSRLVQMLLWICAVSAAVMGVLLLVLMSIAARVKVKGWWKNSLIVKFCAWIWRGLKKMGNAISAKAKERDWVQNNFLVRFFVWLWNGIVRFFKWLWSGLSRFFKWLGVGLRHGAGKGGAAFLTLPLIWRGVFLALVVFAVEMVAFAGGRYGGWEIFAILVNLAVAAGIIYVSSVMKELQVASQSIADGDLNYRVNTKGMILDFKSYGENLNRIGEGLSLAVEDRLKSERMKTELITNVSHDLKTPLTSIVNYVDLLKKEELTGTAGEYVEVLDRQSARLKKLTEDLVEASKASTGNLQVTVETVNICEFLGQAQAEYSARLVTAGLKAVMQLPEEALLAKSDGRYLWRIMDNLLGNVCKYAMADTRVYISANRKDDYVVIAVKNISRECLNITADELMERFVRGDSSRNTEGSGLGLSIAQSLAALMGGKLELTVDGDLFKAEVYLPAASEEK